jgi:hypothetical protein
MSGPSRLHPSPPDPGASKPQNAEAGGLFPVVRGLVISPSLIQDPRQGFGERIFVRIVEIAIVVVLALVLVGWLGRAWFQSRI